MEYKSINAIHITKIYEEVKFSTADQIERDYFRNKLFRPLPLQMVLTPLHVPFAWQFRTREPLKINPLSQENRMLSGNTVRSPYDDPFKGTLRRPQSTAARKHFKHNEKNHQHNSIPRMKRNTKWLSYLRKT